MPEGSRSDLRRSRAHLESPGQSDDGISAPHAKELLSFFELRSAWTSFSRVDPSLHEITATKLAKSYQENGYFARNLRAIKVV